MDRENGMGHPDHCVQFGSAHLLRKCMKGYGDNTRAVIIAYKHFKGELQCSHDLPTDPGNGSCWLVGLYYRINYADLNIVKGTIGISDR